MAYQFARISYTHQLTEFEPRVAGRPDRFQPKPMNSSPGRVSIPGMRGQFNYEIDRKLFEDDAEEACKTFYVLSKVFAKHAPPSSADTMADLYQKHLTVTILESLASMVIRQAISSPPRFLQLVYQELTSGETVLKKLRLRMRFAFFSEALYHIYLGPPLKEDHSYM